MLDRPLLTLRGWRFAARPTIADREADRPAFPAGVRVARAGPGVPRTRRTPWGRTPGAADPRIPVRGLAPRRPAQLVGADPLPALPVWHPLQFPALREDAVGPAPPPDRPESRDRTPRQHRRAQPGSPPRQR